MLKKTVTLFAFALMHNAFAQTITYTIQKGDTPYSVAKKHGMSLEELYAANPSIKKNGFNLGMDIEVKGKMKKANAKTPDNIRPELGYIIIKPKQTIYGITKQYKISEDKLRKLNPDLESQIKIGAKVNIPADLIRKYADDDAQNSAYEIQIQASSAPVKAPLQTYSGTGISDDNFVTYTVQSGDTIFGIINKFGTSLDELVKLNPSLEEGLKAGMILKLRKAEKAYSKKNDDALNVVIILPFGYDDNATKYRNLSVDFLSGAKLAIERNAQAGMKMNINVIDAGSESSFKKALRQINKDNTDLIIGPFFKSNILETLDYVKEAKIPMVAPFANSEDLYGYSNLIIVETHEKFYADKIVEEVKAVYSNQKIFIVGNASQETVSYIQKELSKKLHSKVDINIVSHPSQIKADVNMMTGKAAPVLAILTSNEGNIGNQFADKMIALASEAPGTKAFSMVYDPTFEKKSDALAATHLVYLMDRKINTSGGAEKKILSDYQSKYCKTPGKYAVIGYDVMNDILTRENSRGEIFNNMGKEQTHLATKFSYQRIQKNGAFVNTAFRVVRLIP